MKELKKLFMIASILFLIIAVSYPLLMGAIYSLADQDARVIPTLEGIKPVIDILYLTALSIGMFTMATILWCMCYGKENPEVV